MKKFLFVIVDKIADDYSDIFYARSDAHAIRLFQNFIRQGSEKPEFFPDDYVLLSVGFVEPNSFSDYETVPFKIQPYCKVIPTNVEPENE